MKWLLIIIVAIFAASTLIEKTTHFVEQIKSRNSDNSQNGFEVKLSILPVDNKKSEDVPPHNPHNN